MTQTNPGNDNGAAAVAAAVDATLEAPAAPKPFDYESLVRDDATPPADAAAEATPAEGDATPVEGDGDGATAGVPGEGGGEAGTEGADAGDAAGDGDAAGAGDGDAGEGTAQAPADAAGVQELRQELAAQTAKLDKMIEKAMSGQQLSAAEERQAEAAQTKAARIREQLKAAGDKFDLLADGNDRNVAEAVVDHDDRLARLEAENAELRRAREQDAAAAAFSGVTQKYPGVDVKAVWSQAVVEAADLVGVADLSKLAADDPLVRAVATAANKIFGQRAGAAAKTLKDKQAATATAPTTATAAAAAAARPATKPAPAAGAKVTPGGARVTQGGGVNGGGPGEPSPEARWLRKASALVRDDG